MGQLKIRKKKHLQIRKPPLLQTLKKLLILLTTQRHLQTQTHLQTLKLQKHLHQSKLFLLYHVQKAANDLESDLKAQEDSIQSLVGELAKSLSEGSKKAQHKVKGKSEKLKGKANDASFMLKEMLNQLDTDMDDFNSMNKEYDTKMTDGKMDA